MASDEGSVSSGLNEVRGAHDDEQQRVRTHVVRRAPQRRPEEILHN